VTNEKRYTLSEAQRELCAGLSGDPVRLVCGCCGKSWGVQSEAEV
jgi:hypothetical protein